MVRGCMDVNVTHGTAHDNLHGGHNMAMCMISHMKVWAGVQNAKCLPCQQHMTDKPLHVCECAVICLQVVEHACSSYVGCLHEHVGGCLLSQVFDLCWQGALSSILPRCVAHDACRR